MKIIVLTVGEPPLYDESKRLHRSGILSHKLSIKHKVEYWSSNFFHQKKEYFDIGKYKINKNLNFVSFRSLGYNKNISIKRYIDQFLFAFYIFFKLLKNRKNIDLIIVSMPTCDLAFSVSLFSKIFKIKYIVDVRDMWPDIFWLKFNKKKFISLIIKLLSLPQIIFRNYALKNANGITSITQDFLEWSTKKNKNKKLLSNYFYLSPNNNFTKILNKTFNDKINICFFGVISYSKFDFKTLIKFLNTHDSNNLIFHICGDGDDLEKLKKDFSKYPNVKIYGYLNINDLSKIANISHYGLANYIPTEDFNMSIPNKIIEYLSYNIQIIYSLEGSTKKLLSANNIGRYYKSGDIYSLISVLSNLPYSQSGALYYNFYKEYFDKDKIYSSFCQFVESVYEKT